MSYKSICKKSPKYCGRLPPERCDLKQPWWRKDCFSRKGLVASTVDPPQFIKQVKDFIVKWSTVDWMENCGWSLLQHVFVSIFAGASMIRPRSLLKTPLSSLWIQGLQIGSFQSVQRRHWDYIYDISECMHKPPRLFMTSSFRSTSRYDISLMFLQSKGRQPHFKLMKSFTIVNSRSISTFETHIKADEILLRSMPGSCWVPGKRVNIKSLNIFEPSSPGQKHTSNFGFHVCSKRNNDKYRSKFNKSSHSIIKNRSAHWHYCSKILNLKPREENNRSAKLVPIEIQQTTKARKWRQDWVRNSSKSSKDDSPPGFPAHPSSIVAFQGSEGDEKGC